MEQTIADIRALAQQDLAAADSCAAVEQLKVKYLGRKGSIQGLMPNLRNATPEERPVWGQMINTLKQEVTGALDAKFDELLHAEETARLATETVDVTLPGRRQFRGRKHLITQTLEHVCDVLVGMGFSIQTGPDVDSEYNNFEALNFPPEHPARDMQDTFYINSKELLRTHLTNLQAQIMEKHEPPFRVAAPGKAYRNEAISSRSHVFFHQVDVFYVDKGVTFADLMATKEEFLKKMFGRNIKWRFRNSYFPFVEPGMECDVSCLLCGGSGCSVCKHTGWLEISGSGMMHPEVLRSGGIDPEEWSGFAWGMGLERLVMLLHGIHDIRTFTENDLGFLKQFG